ncbi:MAG: hypothetical protein AMXMBFR46_00470 [Acidimicrobiia bacterium]
MSHELDREALDRGLTNFVRDNDERFPPEWRLSQRGRSSEWAGESTVETGE